MPSAFRILAVAAKCFIAVACVWITLGSHPFDGSSWADALARLPLNPLAEATLLAAWSETLAGRSWRDWTDKFFVWGTLPICLAMAFFWISLSVGGPESTGL